MTQNLVSTITLMKNEPTDIVWKVTGIDNQIAIAESRFNMVTREALILEFTAMSNRVMKGNMDAGQAMVQTSCTTSTGLNDTVTQDIIDRLAQWINPYHYTIAQLEVSDIETTLTIYYNDDT